MALTYDLSEQAAAPYQYRLISELKIKYLDNIGIYSPLFQFITLILKKVHFDFLIILCV